MRIKLPDSRDNADQLLLESKESKNKEIIQEFYQFLMTSNQSYRVVENNHLRRALQLSGAPQDITSISRRAIPPRFGNLYRLTKRDLKTILERQDAISISCDYWTSPSMEQYLCIFVHFTDENFEYSEHLKICSILLRQLPIPVLHWGTWFISLYGTMDLKGYYFLSV